MLQPWLVSPEWLSNFLASGSIGSFRAPSKMPSSWHNLPIIPIYGAIVPRGSAYMSAISGDGGNISTVEGISEALDQHANSEKIILDIDSPGGVVTGISELADKIYSMRPKVEAYVSGMAASAAYWLASAANKITMSDTAEVGSVGVVMSYTDYSELLAKMGIKIKDIISSNAPLKRVTPDTDDGLSYYQARIDEIASVFVDKIAKYRGVPSAFVLSNFGQGGLIGAKAALSSGMADQISTFKSYGAKVGKAMQDIESLRAEVDALKAENASLKDRIEALKNDSFAAIEAEKKRVAALLGLTSDKDILQEAIMNGLSPGDVAMQIITSGRAQIVQNADQPTAPVISYNKPKESDPGQEMRDGLLAAIRRKSNV